MSGNLEVNCLACHDASAAYDQAEYANQVAKENFRYAPAAASGLGLVTGSTKQMPDLFDYLLPNSVEDSLQAQIPKVEYAAADFLPSGKVAFDIVRDAKSSQCYYCHTNVDIGVHRRRPVARATKISTWRAASAAISAIATGSTTW